MYTSIRSFTIVNFATALSLALLAAPADAAGPCKELLPVRVKVVEQADQGVDAFAATSPSLRAFTNSTCSMSPPRSKPGAPTSAVRSGRLPRRRPRSRRRSP